jgi:putative ABC transport system permease protein
MLAGASTSSARTEADRLQLQVGLQLHAVQVGGTVGAGGGPLAVMDIGAAQDLFGRGGQLSRIDVRLAPGADREAVLRALALPGDVDGLRTWPTRRSA